MNHFSSDQVQAQLKRIMASPEFVSGKKLGQFLSYVVKQTLNGGPDELTQYAIAVEGLGYPETFDPTTVPNVRVLASRLRRALDNYYAKDGTADPIRISVPKGGYISVFMPNQEFEPVAGSASGATCFMTCNGDSKAVGQDSPSIAILPLEYLGNGSEHTFIASGITEEVIIALTHF